MSDFNRRDAIKIGAGVVAGATVAAAGPASAQVPEFKPVPEKGATLRVLRPSKFVQGDETLWLENTKKYEAATGVKVRVDSESWEDLRPKSAVAANVGSGPGHRLWLVRRCAPISRQAGRRHRPRQLSR